MPKKGAGGGIWTREEAGGFQLAPQANAVDRLSHPRKYREQVPYAHGGI